MGQSWERYIREASRGIENWHALDELIQFMLVRAHQKRDMPDEARSTDTSQLIALLKRNKTSPGMDP